MKTSRSLTETTGNMHMTEQTETEQQALSVLNATAPIVTLIVKARTENDPIVKAQLWSKIGEAAINLGYLRLCSYTISKIANLQGDVPLDAELVRFAKEGPRDE